MSSRGGRAHDYGPSMEENNKRSSGSWERRGNRSARMSKAKFNYSTSLNVREGEARDRHVGLYSPDCTVTYTPLSRSPPPNASQMDFDSGIVGGRLDSLANLYMKEKMPDRDTTQRGSNRILDARSRSPIFPNVEDREVFEINVGQSSRYQDGDGALFRPLEWEENEHSPSPPPRQQFRGSPDSPQGDSWEDRRDRRNRREKPEINRPNKRDLIERGNRERGNWHEKQEYGREDWPKGKDGSGDRWAERLDSTGGNQSNDPWLTRRASNSLTDNWHEMTDRNIPKDDRLKRRDDTKHFSHRSDRNKRKDADDTRYERNRRIDSNNANIGWMERRDSDASKDKWLERRDRDGSMENLLEGRGRNRSTDRWLEKRDNNSLESVDRGSFKDNVLERRDRDNSIDNVLDRRGLGRPMDSGPEKRDHERLKDNWLGRRDWDSSKEDWAERNNYGSSKNDWPSRRDPESFKDNWVGSRGAGSPNGDRSERRGYLRDSRPETSGSRKDEWLVRHEETLSGRNEEKFNVRDRFMGGDSPRGGLFEGSNWPRRSEEDFPLRTRASHLFDSDREMLNEKMQTNFYPPPAKVYDDDLPLLPPPPPPPILSLTPPAFINTTDYSKPLPFKPSVMYDVESVKQSMQLLEKLKKKQEILSKCELKIREIYRSRTKLSNEPSSFIPSVQRIIQLNCNESPVVFTHQALSFNCIKKKQFNLEELQFKANLKGTHCTDTYEPMGPTDRKTASNMLQHSIEDSKSSDNILDQFGSVDDPVLTDKGRSPSQFSSIDVPYQKSAPPVRPPSPRRSRTRKPVANPFVDMAYRILQGPSTPTHLSPQIIKEPQQPQPNLDSDFSSQSHSRGSGWPVYKAPVEMAPQTSSHSVRIPPPHVTATPIIEPPVTQSRDYRRPNKSLITLNLLPRDNFVQASSSVAPYNNASYNDSFYSSPQADSAYAHKVEEFLAKIQGESKKTEKHLKPVKGYSVVLSDDDDVIYVGESKNSPIRNRRRSRSSSRRFEKNERIPERPSSYERKRKFSELPSSSRRPEKKDLGNRAESIPQQPSRHDMKNRFPLLPSSSRKSEQNDDNNRKETISDQSSKDEMKSQISESHSSCQKSEKNNDGTKTEGKSEQPSSHERKRQFTELSDEPPGTSPVIPVPPPSVTSPKRSRLEEVQNNVKPGKRHQSQQILPKLTAPQCSNLTLIVGNKKQKADMQRTQQFSVNPTKPNLIVVGSTICNSNEVGNKNPTNSSSSNDQSNLSIPDVNKTFKDANVSNQPSFGLSKKGNKKKKNQINAAMYLSAQGKLKECNVLVEPKISSTEINTKVISDNANISDTSEEKITPDRVSSDSKEVSGLTKEKTPSSCAPCNIAGAQGSSEEKTPSNCGSSNLGAAQGSSEEKTPTNCGSSNLGAAQGSSEVKKPPDFTSSNLAVASDVFEQEKPSGCASPNLAVVPRSSEEKNTNCKEGEGTETSGEVNKQFWKEGSKVSDFENIFKEKNEITTAIQNIQTNDERLQKVYNNTVRNKTINKSLCIKNGMLCLNNQALGIRIVVSTIEEKIIYYLHCLFQHRNDSLTIVLKKYFTPIKELGEKMKSALKSCDHCLKRPVSSSKDDRQCSTDPVSNKNTDSVEESFVEHSPNLTTVLQESPSVSQDASDKTVEDPMSLVKEIQSSSKHVNDIISKLDQDEKKSSYLLKNNILLKRCHVGGKTLLKILIPEDKIEQVIMLAHKVFSIHGNKNSVLSILEKQFSPMLGLEDSIEKAIAACSHCSSSKSN